MVCVIGMRFLSTIEILTMCKIARERYEIVKKNMITTYGFGIH